MRRSTQPLPHLDAGSGGSDELDRVFAARHAAMVADPASLHVFEGGTRDHPLPWITEQLLAINWGNESIRTMVRATTAAFVDRAAPYYHGRLIDIGCGLQPHRAAIERAGAEYHGYDRPDYAGSNIPDVPDGIGPAWEAEVWDTVFMTHILTHVDNPLNLLFNVYGALEPDRGRLVLVYTTNWNEVDSGDRWRFTSSAMVELLRRARLRALEHVRLCEVVGASGFLFPICHGVIAAAEG